MRINNNMAAMNAWRSLTTNSANMTKSLEKLSSGFRINKAGDDAAGLAVSEKMRAQIRGMNMATRNAQDGVSMVQTAEGGAAKIGDMLQRMRELAVQASSQTLDKNTDLGLIQKEADELITEIGRVADGLSFNGIKLIDGSMASTAKKVQVGANTGDTIDLKFDSLKTTALKGKVNHDDDDGTTPEVDRSLGSLHTSGDGVDTFTLKDHASEAIKVIDGALSTVNSARAQMGAYQNRLESAIGTLQTQVENITSAESRIRDVDMASEMANFTKHNILQQASTSMLAQANQSTQGILSLLR